jgi:hypothetical membrane protein
MTRLAVFVAALVFIVGFAALTISAIAQQGLSAEAVLAVIVIVLLGVGVIGALLGTPRDPPR